jgi:hypothetical protein
MAYRGKHPHVIREIYSPLSRRGRIAKTNVGFRYQILPYTTEGSIHAPEPGKDISFYIQSPDYSVLALDGDVRNTRG